MQDLQPSPDQTLDWREVVSISKYLKEEWEADLPLERVLRENDPSYCGLEYIMWEQQRMSHEEMREFRNGKEVLVATIFHDAVQVVRVNRNTLEKYLLVFHSNNRQSLRIMAGLPLKMEYPTLVTVETKVHVMVHMKMPHPLLTSIMSYKGYGKVEYEMDTPRIVYQFTTEGYEDQVLQLEDSVKFYWFQRQSQVADEINYLSKEYYQSSPAQYVHWTYSTHRAQVVQVLAALPEDAIIVAPGDGIGVVAENWKGEVIAGDQYYSSKKVDRETFLQTMIRGKRRDPNAILFLSYVTSLMTDIELYSASNWTGPVVWLDSSDRCKLPGMAQQARNLFTRGCVIRNYDSQEKSHDSSYSRYTENLLGIPKIS